MARTAVEADSGVMPWSRFDDDYYDHPKIVRAGNAATGVHARSITWSNRHHTDGFVPRDVVMTTLNDPDCALAARLVTVGLYQEVEDGYVIHDFLDYNLASKDIKNDRQAAKLRMRRLRSGSGVVRPNREGTSEKFGAGDGDVPGRDGRGSSSGSSVSKSSEEAQTVTARATAAVESPEALMGAWNSAGTRLPRARELSPARRKHAVARLREHPIAWWLDLFRRMDRTPFLRGENDRGWRADFGWTVESPENAVKVLEGKYDAVIPRGPHRVPPGRRGDGPRGGDVVPLGEVLRQAASRAESTPETRQGDRDDEGRARLAQQRQQLEALGKKA